MSLIKWKGYTNWGGCQIGSETWIMLLGLWTIKSLSSLQKGSAIIEEIYFIEILAQQEHWQNGEHSSLWFASSGNGVVTTCSAFILLVLIAKSPSAQGRQLIPITRKAIMKAKIFMAAKIADYKATLAKYRVKNYNVVAFIVWRIWFS